MSINNITRTNTIDEWRIQTNQSAGELNKLETGDYTKTDGTLKFNGTSNVVIDAEGTSLQVTNTALFSTEVIVGKDISLGAQETATGNLSAGGTLSVYGVNVGVYVANSIVSNGNVIIKNNIVAANATINSNVVVVGTANLGYLGVANSGVFGKEVSVGTTLIVTGNTAVGNLTTANMVYAGTLRTDGLANVGGTFQATGDARFSSDVIVSGDVNVASNLIVTGEVTGNLTVSNTTITENVIVTGRTDLEGILHTVGTATFDNDVAVEGDFRVDGKFSLAGDIVYDADTLILSATIPVTAGYAYLGVNRGNTLSTLGTTNANAYFRWNETDKIWQIRDVDNTDNSTSFSKILTANTIKTSMSSVANTDFPSTWVAKNYSDNSTIGPYLKANAAFAVANAASNTFVGTNDSEAAPSGGVVSFGSLNGITVTGSSNVLTFSTAQDIRTTASPTFAAMTLTAPLAITQGGTGAQSAGGALTALLPTGTTSGYVLTTGGPGNFYWAAGGGGTGGSAVPGTAINTSKLTYTASAGQTTFTAPVFTAGTGQLKLFINGVRQHADYTETTTSLSGVSCTGSAGQFSCTSSSLSVGQAIVITGALSGTATISQYYTGKTYYIIATNGTTTFTLSESAGGSALTTTSGTLTGLSFTTLHRVVLDTGASVNDLVMVEVDGYVNRPYFANNIGFTPVGNIPSTSNTIQLGMESIESRKANLSGAVFTGGISVIAPTTIDSSTNVPTTAWVKGLLNTTAYTFASSISGNAGTVTNGVYTTGAQTIAGVKTFSSTIAGSINGNAATVTGGVYTSGDQTIAGTKTFSSKITGSISGNCDGYASYLYPISGPASYKLAYTADGARTNAGEWGRVVMKYDGNGQTYGVRVDRADYADSAGGVAWTNVSSRPSNVSSFTNDSGYITSGGRAYPRRSDGGDLNFYWSGQSGQPPWLWGGSDGANMYVYNPSNFSVNYATTAGSATNAAEAGNAGYVRGGLVWREKINTNFSLAHASWSFCNWAHSSALTDGSPALVMVTWSRSGGGNDYSYYTGAAVIGGTTGMANAQSATRGLGSNDYIYLGGMGSYGEVCFLNTTGANGTKGYFYAYWSGNKGVNNGATSPLTATLKVWVLEG